MITDYQSLLHGDKEPSGLRERLDDSCAGKRVSREATYIVGTNSRVCQVEGDKLRIQGPVARITPLVDQTWEARIYVPLETGDFAQRLGVTLTPTKAHERIENAGRLLQWARKSTAFLMVPSVRDSTTYRLPGDVELEIAIMSFMQQQRAVVRVAGTSANSVVDVIREYDLDKSTLVHGHYAHALRDALR